MTSYVKVSGLITPSAQLTEKQEPGSTNMWFHQDGSQVTRSGLTNPSYRDQIKHFQDASTDYSVDILELRQARTCRMTIKSKAPNQTYGIERIRTFGSFAPIGFADCPSDDGTVAAIAYDRALLDAKSQIQAFDGITFLGELPETIKMIGKTADSLLGLHHNFLRSLINAVKGFSSLRKFRKFARDSYLEAVFGWMPLYYDIQDLGEALSRAAKDAPVTHINAKGKAHIDFPAQSTMGILPSGWGTYTVSTAGTVRAKAKITGALRAAIPGTSPDVFGFTLNNVLPAAWELIPFSWLVDYFTNIGIVIDAVGLSQIQFVYLVVNTRTDRLATRTYSNGQSFGIFQELEDADLSGTSRARIAKFARAKETSIPVPSLRFRNYSEWNWKKGLNTLAVLDQQLGAAMRRLV